MNAYKFKDIYVGQVEEFTFEITDEKMKQFLEMTGDNSPIHTDKKYAKEKGYEDILVYGMLTSSALSTLSGGYLPGRYSLTQSVQISFSKPVFVSSSPLKIRGEVIEKDERFSIITVKVSIFDNKNTKVCKGKMQIGVLQQ